MGSHGWSHKSGTVVLIPLWVKNCPPLMKWRHAHIKVSNTQLKPRRQECSTFNNGWQGHNLSVPFLWDDCRCHWENLLLWDCTGCIEILYVIKDSWPCFSSLPMLYKAFFTLHPWAEIRRMSAGILSPPFISTMSPTTSCSAGSSFFSASLMTRACWRDGSITKMSVALFFKSPTKR